MTPMNHNGPQPMGPTIGGPRPPMGPNGVPGQMGPRVQPNINGRPGPNQPNGPQQQPPMPQQQNRNGPPPGFVPEQIKAQGPLTEAEKMGVDLIPRLMQSYYRIIRKKIEDTVPKAIVAFLVKASKEQLQETLVRTLYNPEKLDQLLFEDPIVREKRAAAREMVNVLGRAQNILDRIGDIRSVDDIKKK